MRSTFDIEDAPQHVIVRDRMLASALNFAIGFFGYPFEGQYQQLISIEHPDVSDQFVDSD